MAWFRRRKKTEELTHILYKTCLYSGAIIYGEMFNPDRRDNVIVCLIVFDNWKVKKLT